MGLWQTISSWWSKDTVEAATEATRDNDQAERDVAEEDYESRKDDQSIPGSYIGGAVAGTDFERDSEPPRDSAP